MSTSEGSRIRDRLCSVFSNASKEDPGGSAPSWTRCVIIELAPPWESDVAESRHFPPMVSGVLDRAERRGYATRLQCVMPDPAYSVDGQSRVMYFSRPDGPFATYDRDEFVVPEQEVGPLVEALLEHPEGPRRFEPYRQDASQVRDILVCTHGAHDVCCASFGYPIYQALRDRYARDANDSLRVWQVSHLGGHRFAPNLVDLPEGRNWVRIGPDDLELLVLRNRPVSELRRSYRGWLGLDSPFEQVVEREVFMREGWDWAGRLIAGQVLEMGDDRQQAEVRIDFAGPDGDASGVYEATVERNGNVPRVDCPGGTETGMAEQYSVSRLVKVR